MENYKNLHNINLNESIPDAPFPEMRVIKIRLPDKAKKDDITNLLSQIHNSGFNLCILDAFYEGQPIFNSKICNKYKLLKQRPCFKNIDPISIFLSCAKEYNISVFLSIDVLLAGKLSEQKSNPILRRYNKWMARTINGKLQHPAQDRDSIYICPSNPNFRRFIADLTCEIVDSYPINGIYFDFVQFPFYSNNPKTAFCFCDLCKEQTAQQVGIDLESIPLEIENKDYIRWTAWRENQLYNTLIYLKSRLKENRKNVFMVIAVNSNYQKQLTTRIDLADWQVWALDEIPDMICIKSYPTQNLLNFEQFEKDTQNLPEDLIVLPVFNLDDIKEFVNEHKKYILKGVKIPGQLFFSQLLLMNNTVDFIRQEIFEDDAYLPLTYPIHSITYYLKIAREASEENEETIEFIDDLLQIFESNPQTLKIETLTSILNNLMGLEKMVQRNEILKDYNKIIFLKNINLATKLIKLLIKGI